MKIFIRFMFIFILASATAPVYADTNTYIEIKSEVKYDQNLRRGDTTNHTRFGFEKKTTFGKLYVEGGRMSEGHSFEMGYKYRWDKNLTIKGKWEGKDAGTLKNKLETEIRYTF